MSPMIKPAGCVHQTGTQSNGNCLITGSGLKEDFVAELYFPTRVKGLCGAKDKN